MAKHGICPCSGRPGPRHTRDARPSRRLLVDGAPPAPYTGPMNLYWPSKNVAVRAAKQVFTTALLFVGAIAIAGCAGLQVSSTSPSDSGLEASVLERLGRDEVVPMDSIGVRAHNGVVTLMGTIDDPGIRARAVSIVEGAPGVSQVVNQLGP